MLGSCFTLLAAILVSNFHVPLELSASRAKRNVQLSCYCSSLQQYSTASPNLVALVHSTCNGFSMASPPGVRFFKRLCKVKILLSVKTVRPTVVVCFQKTRRGEKQLGGEGGGGGKLVDFFANVRSIFWNEPVRKPPCAMHIYNTPDHRCTFHIFVASSTAWRSAN